MAYYNYYSPLVILPLNTLSLSPTATKKIRAYVDRMESGNSIDYRTNMFALPDQIAKFEVTNSRISGIKGFKPLPREWILDCFIPHLMADLKDYPLLRKFEESFIKYSTSSRSIQLPWNELSKKLQESYKFADFVPDNEAYEALKLGAQDLNNYVRTYIKKKSLRPIKHENAIDEMVATSSWGAPHFVDGTEWRSGILFRDNRPLYLRTARRIIECIKENKHIPLEYISFLAITRIQEADMSNGPNTKNRIVWSDAHGATILAATAFPFLRACASMPCRSILKGLSYTNSAIAKAIRLPIKQTFLSADQTAFDNHINGNIVREFINPIIMESFNWDNREDERLGLQWYLYSHMWESPIITPGGIYTGSHGMPSGVLFVNEVDSLYLMLITFAINHLQDKYKFEIMEVQGDDLLLRILGQVDKEDAVDVFVSGCARYNLEANKLKQMISYYEALFVKRYWCLETPNGYRSKIWSLTGLMNMEHVKDWRDPMYEARAGSVLSNHYITDPGIGNFFTQVMLGFPEYQLGYKLPNGYLGIVQLAGGVKDVSLKLNLGSWDNMLATTQGAQTNQRIMDSDSMSIEVWIKTLKSIKGPLPVSWVWPRVSKYLKSFEGLSKNARNRLRKKVNSTLPS